MNQQQKEEANRGEMLPREKLRQGLDMKPHEYIAVLLGTGMKGKSVFELSREIYDKYGSLSSLFRKSHEDLINEFKGIGEAKALMLEAAFKLSLAMFKEVSEQMTMDNADCVYQYMCTRRWEEFDQEHVYVIMLNTKIKLIRCEMISKGTLTEAIIHPREVFRPAIQYGAHSIILVHNHPSGDPTPSRADNEMTKCIDEASKIIGIELRDHIIIGLPTKEREKNYYSYKRAFKL